MDYLYLAAAVAFFILGAGITYSGVQRWRQRHQPPPLSLTTEVTDSRLRPAMQFLAGVVTMAWAGRVIFRFAMTRLIR